MDQLGVTDGEGSPRMGLREHADVQREVLDASRDRIRTIDVDEGALPPYHVDWEIVRVGDLELGIRRTKGSKFVDLRFGRRSVPGIDPTCLIGDHWPGVPLSIHADQLLEGMMASWLKLSAPFRTGRGWWPERFDLVLMGMPTISFALRDGWPVASVGDRKIAFGDQAPVAIMMLQAACDYVAYQGLAEQRITDLWWKASDRTELPSLAFEPRPGVGETYDYRSRRRMVTDRWFAHRNRIYEDEWRRTAADLFVRSSLGVNPPGEEELDPSWKTSATYEEVQARIDEHLATALPDEDARVRYVAQSTLAHGDVDAEGAMKAAEWAREWILKVCRTRFEMEAVEWRRGFAMERLGDEFRARHAAYLEWWNRATSEKVATDA